MAANEKTSLLNDSSDSEVDFNINEDYAKRYDKWRQSEELQKLKAKYGDDDSSSSSDSDEPMLIPINEKEFLKTLSLLKSKDPKIYDENVSFFNEAVQEENKPKEKKSKPLYMKDYETKMILEKNGEWSDDDDDDNDVSHNVQPTYEEELQEIKKSFKLPEDDSGSDDDENLLRVHKKGKAEKEKEDAAYIEWLKGEKDLVDDDDEDVEDITFLQRHWNDPNLEADEQHLKNIILNKEFIDEEKDQSIPSYEEIVSDNEKEDTFEQKYNFRFEEPDSEFIKQYPRIIGDSLRKKDSRRKLKREEYQERKKQEKLQKIEEIKRLKALKRAEIEEKLDQLKDIAGNKIDFDTADIDGDFDPAEHDKRMKELFNDEYYELEETEKPQFPSDEECDIENWDNWKGIDSESHSQQDDGPHCEDSNFNMDADYDPRLAFEREMIESQSQSSKKRKKKSKFATAIEKAKPVFDPASKSFEQYFDEYYRLDCEDVVGDLPVRFKYREVVPNDFGLSVEEILNSRDKELNKWCSLKKACQYRYDNEELYDVQAYQKKAQNMNVKKKVLTSLFEEPEKETPVKTSSNDSNKKSKKRKSRKVNMKENIDNLQDGISSQKPEVERVKLNASDVPSSSSEIEKKTSLSTSSKKSKKRKLKNLNREENIDNPDNDISSQNVEVKRVKLNDCEVPSSSSEITRTNELNTDHSIVDSSTQVQNNSGTSKKKRKRKKKKPKNTLDSQQCDVPLHVKSNTVKQNWANKTQQKSGHAKQNWVNKTQQKSGDAKQNWVNKTQQKSRHAKQNWVNKTQQKSGDAKQNWVNKTQQNFNNLAADKRLQLSDSRLQAYGINPKKFKNRFKYSHPSQK